MIAEAVLSATWYAKGLRNPEALSAATRLYPRYTRLCVHRGHRCVRVRVVVNDVPEDPRVQLDLSRGAFRKLAPLRRGRIDVWVHVVVKSGSCECDKNH